jgi:hypothetical protein
MAFFETLALIALITSIVANIAITVYIVYLTFQDVVNWFRNRQSQINKRKVAFTLQQQISSGKHKTIQGIFDTGSNDLNEARIINSDSVDSRIADAHRYNELVLYE